MAEESQIITLKDQEGGEFKFEVLDMLESKDQRYVVLHPVNNEEDAEGEVTEAVIMRLEEGENDDFILAEVNDDDEWDRVAKEFEAKWNEDEESN